MIFFPTFYFLHTMHFVCEFRSPIVVKVIVFTSVLKINGKKDKKILFWKIGTIVF